MSSTSTRISTTHLSVASTASLAATYIPPFRPSSANGSPPAYATTTTRKNPNPTTPAFLNDYDWINSYLTIHKMSVASYRYAYLLWFVIVFGALIFAVLHLTGGRGGAWGARWSKWALRRRTWRKKSTLAAIRKSNKPHRQPWSLPSNAQILSLIVLFVIPAILCTVGSDYISPGTQLWDFTHNLTRRHVPEVVQSLLPRRPPIASTPTTRPPDFTIPKQWWTAGGRTGIIAFSLFPLVVLFALKAPPFAIFAIPYTIQIHFDKLSRLHRWTGRLIWFITTVHVLTWGVQLNKDQRHGHKGRAWNFVWVYHKFIYGMVAYIALTLLTLFSAGPLRTRFYEFFYISHIILVPTTLVFSALHFPPIWWWCWAPLFLWILERSYRMLHFLYLNGILGAGGSRKASSFVYPDDEPPEKPYSTNGGYAGLKPILEMATPRKTPKSESWEMDVRSGKSIDSTHSSPRRVYSQPEDARPDRTERVTSGESTGSITGSIVSFYEASEANARRAPLLGRATGDSFIPPTERFSAGTNATDETAAGEWSPGTVVDNRTSESHGAFPLGRRHSSYAPVPNTANGVTRSSTVSIPQFTGPQRQIANLNFPSMHPLPSIINPPSAHISRLPPPGYAKAVLLPGRTVRLSLITARRFSWAPGQHVLLTIPSISLFTSHPFTVASVSDSAIAGSHGREMVLVIRAKRGFTRQLWEEVKRRCTDKRRSLDVTQKSRDDKKGSLDVDAEVGVGIPTLHQGGVVFRAWVDGPFGSSVRAHWGSHSSVVIVCGGSGVSFGTAIMEYLCLCLNGRDGRSLGGKSGGVGKDSFVTRRVRFIWLVREYSHLQWCAPIIRRCMDMIPNPAILQIDIFVTNFNESARSHALGSTYLSSDNLGGFAAPGADESLVPPVPHFAKEGKLQRRMSVSSDDSMDSNVSGNSSAELHYADGGKPPTLASRAKTVADDEDDEDHVLDLTNFDGDDDTKVPGEAQFSLRLKKEGRLRRAQSRKVSSALQAKRELDQKVQTQGRGDSDDHPPMPTARIVPPVAYKSPTKARNWDPTEVLLPTPAQRGISLYDRPLSADSTQQPLPLSASPPLSKWGEASRTVTPRAEDARNSIAAPIPMHPRGASFDHNRLSVAESLQDRLPSPSPSGAFQHENGSYDTRTLGGSESVRHLIAPHPHRASSTPGATTTVDGTATPLTPSLSVVGDDVVLDFDDEEIDDLNAVSEMARPGKPKIETLRLYPESGTKKSTERFATVGHSLARDCGKCFEEFIDSVERRVWLDNKNITKLNTIYLEHKDADTAESVAKRFTTAVNMSDLPEVIERVAFKFVQWQRLIYFLWVRGWVTEAYGFSSEAMDRRALGEK
ncbi:hypothetical protein FRB99_006251, partial [Tulasnella sp. 403]